MKKKNYIKDSKFEKRALSSRNILSLRNKSILLDPEHRLSLSYFGAIISYFDSMCAQDTHGSISSVHNVDQRSNLS